MEQPGEGAAARPQSLRNLAIALLLGLVGLGSVFLASGAPTDLSAIRKIQLPYVIACLALVALDWLSEAWRLRLLSRALGENVPLATILRIVFVGVFFARITPFDSGGEPFQVYALHRNGVPLGHATAVIAVKALLHGVVRVCLGILVPVWLLLTAQGWRLGPAATIALYAGLAVYLGITTLLVVAFVLRGRARAVVWWIINSPPAVRLVGRARLAGLMAKLEGHYRAFRGAIGHFGHQGRWTVAAAGLISLASWSAVLAVPVILVRALGGVSPAAEVAATAVIFYLAVARAPTPGSSGASEVGFAALFARFVPLPLVGVLVLVWRLLTHYLSLLLGFAVAAFSVFGGRSQPPRPPGALRG